MTRLCTAKLRTTASSALKSFNVWSIKFGLSETVTAAILIILGRSLLMIGKSCTQLQLNIREIVRVQMSVMQVLTSAEGFKAVLGHWDGMRLGQNICNHFHNTLHHLYKDKKMQKHAMFKNFLRYT